MSRPSPESGSRPYSVVRCHRILKSLFTVLGGIPSEVDNYVIFIRVVNMMARKCTVNGGKGTPNGCLSWPDF